MATNIPIPIAPVATPAIMKLFETFFFISSAIELAKKSLIFGKDRQILLSQ